jgi:hypothetical protein
MRVELPPLTGSMTLSEHREASDLADQAIGAAMALKAPSHPLDNYLFSLIEIEVAKRLERERQLLEALRELAELRGKLAAISAGFAEIKRLGEDLAAAAAQLSEEDRQRLAVLAGDRKGGITPEDGYPLKSFTVGFRTR